MYVKTAFLYTSMLINKRKMYLICKKIIKVPENCPWLKDH